MKKILIIRFSSIGDIVLTTPIIRCVKQQLKAEVHYLTKKQYEPILAGNPYIDRIHLLQDSFSNAINQLKNENFDFIVDLHNNLRTKRFKAALSKPAKSFPKLNVEKWLIVNFKINRLPNIHIVDRYFETVKELGVSNDNKGLEYHNLSCNRLPENLDGKDFIAFAIGGQYATKKLPTDKIIAICNNINQYVVLLGGKEDVDAGKKISIKSGNQIIDLTGRLTLDESAFVIKKAQKVITHDTGMMHIAAAFKKDIISIWGNTIPAFGMYPYLPDGGSNKPIEVGDLRCRPCSKIGFQKCPKKHFYCMNLIDVEEVIRALNG